MEGVKYTGRGRERKETEGVVKVKERNQNSFEFHSFSSYKKMKPIQLFSGRATISLQY